jgi:hypothetical protein
MRQVNTFSPYITVVLLGIALAFSQFTACRYRNVADSALSSAESLVETTRRANDTADRCLKVSEELAQKLVACVEKHRSGHTSEAKTDRP